jgi:hypothetical protein
MRNVCEGADQKDLSQPREGDLLKIAPTQTFVTFDHRPREGLKRSRWHANAGQIESAAT